MPAIELGGLLQGLIVTGRRGPSLGLAAALVFPSIFQARPLVAATLAPCDSSAGGWCVARTFAGSADGGELGFRFGEPLDADGDGEPDVAAGARFELRGATLQNGEVTVWSGADGKVLRHWDGPFDDGLFGHWTLAVPDLDGDGAADLVVSAPTARVDGDVRGVLLALSPKTGEEIWKREGSVTENFGWDLAPAGDFDGDGRGELFVGAPSIDGGRVYLISAAHASLLRTYSPAEETRSFGFYVAGVGDLDGDGRTDFAAGAPMAMRADEKIVGAAFVVSSATGRTIHRFDGTEHLASYGEVVAALADVTGDGKAEVAVSAPRTADHSRSSPGEVFVYSGEGGELLRRWTGRQPGELYGRMVVSAGDVDGDGTADVAIGAPWYRAGDADKTGRLEIRSGRSGEVLADLVGGGADEWFGWHVRRATDPRGENRPALLVAALRRTVAGKQAAGAIDLVVLEKTDEPAPPQGTTTRGERRSDIK